MMPSFSYSFPLTTLVITLVIQALIFTFLSLPHTIGRSIPAFLPSLPVERRNAENLSETVPASARVMQRFLAESPWDDDTVIGRLQEYLGSRLGHTEAVWVLDGSDFPKQGRKSVGVARQYCGRLGKVASCQAGMFLAYVSPLGRTLVDKRLYLPESWTSDKYRCVAAGVPEEGQSYRSKTELALEMLERALARGHLKAG